MLGQRVLKAQNQKTIDISALANGIYFLKVKQGNIFYTQKFMKQ